MCNKAKKWYEKSEKKFLKFREMFIFAVRNLCSVASKCSGTGQLSCRALRFPQDLLRQ